MMFISAIPQKYLSILYQGRHSVHPITGDDDISILRKYQYLQAESVVIDGDNKVEVGKWIGIFQAFGWKASIISSDTWMDYFGVYPDDPDMMHSHWMNVVKMRYPMMSVRDDNYEAILAACYLHDKHAHEKAAVFA